MAILPTFTTFRWYFCQKLPVSASCTFDAGPPGTITDAAADFESDGVVAGMTVLPSGTTSNDASRLLVETVEPTVLTISADSVADVVSEGAVACTLTGVWVDPDGYEAFPGPFAYEDLVRTAGFDGGITGTPIWFSESAVITLTVNGGAADAVKDVDEYDWYLSQRTDDPAKQFLSIVQATSSATQSFSGSVYISNTALCVSELELEGAAPLNPEKLAEVFRFTAVYCRRRSDGAIQWLDLHKKIMGATV